MFPHLLAKEAFLSAAETILFCSLELLLFLSADCLMCLRQILCLTHWEVAVLAMPLRTCGILNFPSFPKPVSPILTPAIHTGVGCDETLWELPVEFRNCSLAFSRASAFIFIDKVWCFCLVWCYFCASEDDLYLGMGFFSRWRDFGGCSEHRGWVSVLCESVLGSEPAADVSWSCHPKALLSFPASVPPVCPQPRHSQCDPWGSCA